MGVFREWIIVLLIYLLGEFLSKSLSLSIPGNIMGMIFLFLFLVTGILKLEKIERAAKSLLDNLAFLFVPAGVGLMNSFGIINGSIVKILLICIITTVIVMACTGLVVQFVSKKIDSNKDIKKLNQQLKNI